MAFWSTEKLKEVIPARELITPYDEARVVRCAYELSMGSEAFITSNPSDTTQLGAGKKIAIPPGQFGLLITKEVVFVPSNAIAFISIRARVKFQGLVNVSGFHVDPGFKGRLKFSVYNAGSKTIVVDQDGPIFMIWYSDLDRETADLKQGEHHGQAGITADDVMKIQGQVASPAELKRQLDELKLEVEKKFHTTEQSRLFNRTLIMLLIGAVLALLFGSLVKPYFDGSKEERKPTPVNQPAAP